MHRISRPRIRRWFRLHVRTSLNLEPQFLRGISDLLAKGLLLLVEELRVLSLELFMSIDKLLRIALDSVPK